MCSIQLSGAGREVRLRWSAPLVLRAMLRPWCLIITALGAMFVKVVHEKHIGLFPIVSVYAVGSLVRWPHRPSENEALDRAVAVFGSSATASFFPVPMQSSAACAS